MAQSLASHSSGGSSPRFHHHNSGIDSSPSFHLISSSNTALGGGKDFQVGSFYHSASSFAMSPSITIFFFLYFTFSCGPCFGSTISLGTHISIGSCLTVLSSFPPHASAFTIRPQEGGKAKDEGQLLHAPLPAPQRQCAVRITL